MPGQEPIYLIDGSAYIYRAYHAISPLTNSQGLPTHAVYGFANILLRVLKESSPKYLAVVFDARGPNFRHQLYPEYKANRPPMPDDLACQLPYVKKIVEAYRIPSLEREGFEADDLIGSAAEKLKRADHPVVVVSGDKDLLQLVDDRVRLWDPMNNKTFDTQAVRAKYQVEPEKLTDYFALVGDASDNIPGVPGIGPKTAQKLINQFGSLDELYNRLEEVQPAGVRKKLAQAREQAFLSRELIRLKTDLPVPDELAAYARKDPDEPALRELFTFLDFKRLIKTELATARLETTGFLLVTSQEELARVADSLRAAEQVALDTETTSLTPRSADLVGLAVSADPDRAAYLPVGHRDAQGKLLPGQLTLDDLRQHLGPVLADPKIATIGHNLKFDIQVLNRHGLPLSGPLYDTMIASYLLDPSRRSHKLGDLAEEFLERRLADFSEVTGSKKEGSFARVDLEAARDYCCGDVAAASRLWEIFAPKIKELGLFKLFSEVEMALVPILARMEEVGILVDQELLRQLSMEFGEELRRLETRIFELAGEEFNVNSPQQLARVLFEKLKLPRGRKTKTGYSTDISVLEKLAQYHDLPATIIQHRNLAKLKHTYVDKLASMVDPETGRIHSSFNQAVTATGRLSSSNPNLQNIPVRTPEGQRIRQAFISAPGCRFVSADYSQIDLRVLAHYSQDQALLAAFRNNEDIHAATAAEIFRVHPAMVTKEMRRVAKTINFGIVYGMSAFGLAEQLNIGRKEAQVFIDRYFDHYPGVHRYMEEIVATARAQGYVTTLLNRRRMLPEINSTNKARREFAERTAINTPIQGTAADIIKLAAISCHRRLRQEGLQAECVLQIHDELIFEVVEEEVEPLSETVRQAMESVLELSVPLVVNIAVGDNLAQV